MKINIQSYGESGLNQHTEELGVNSQRMVTGTWDERRWFTARRDGL